MFRKLKSVVSFLKIIVTCKSRLFYKKKHVPYLAKDENNRMSSNSICTAAFIPVKK